MVQTRSKKVALDLSKKKVIKPQKSDNASTSKFPNSSNLSKSVPEIIFTELQKSENLSTAKSPNPSKLSEPEVAKIYNLRSPIPSERFESVPEFASTEPKKIDNLRETKSPNPSKRFKAVPKKNKKLRETNSSNPSKPQVFTSPSASSVQLRTKSIFLTDWWLTKLGADKFGIGGFAQTRIGLQRFESASILIRHCTTLVETEDKIVIRLTGLLNLQRARLNGFSSSVCSKFMHGFPFNWEDYTKPISCNDSNEDQSLPSMVDLPMTAMRDLLMSTMGSPNYNSFIEKIISEDLEKDSKSHK